MLTSAKWQSAWLKSHCYGRNIVKKSTFTWSADKILDDLCLSCNSTFRELSLEALQCWRLWMDSLMPDDWKDNTACYTAVKPFCTRKFHPLHKDKEVIETKISLMWLAIHKTQYFMYLEGPQHILEVFIQSCLSWLSCSKVDPDIHNLILNLLSSIFSKNFETIKGKEMFPPLQNDILKSDKLFCRLTDLFLEIFFHWAKLLDKEILLKLWNQFLGHCGKSFKLIPVARWHKIFKLVDTVCADENETFKNKLTLLKSCATALKPVMSNSKFIDCTRLLTTPAEALWKILVELSVKSNEENVTFEHFKNCQETCYVLSSHIIDVYGYESSICMLSKLDDIRSKTILWGLWSGLANYFQDNNSALSLEEYTEKEMKLYRKLRAVAVNFDLDIKFVEKRSALVILGQLDFFRIGNKCKNCSGNEILDNYVLYDDSVRFDENRGQLECSVCGNFGFDIKGVDPAKWFLSKGTNNERQNSLNSSSNSSQSENYEVLIYNTFLDQSSVLCTKKAWLEDRRWMRHTYNARAISEQTNYKLLSYTPANERLVTLRVRNRKGVFIQPFFITLVLDELNRRNRKCRNLGVLNFFASFEKIRQKLLKEEIFEPMTFCLPTTAQLGVELYETVVRFWESVNEILSNIDVRKCLTDLTDISNLLLCGFLFLVNFAKNAVFEGSENQRKELWADKEIKEVLLVLKTAVFMKDVIHSEGRLSKSAFLDNLSAILPKSYDNPLLLWTKYTSEHLQSTSEDYILERITRSPSPQVHNRFNENLINFFQFLYELENSPDFKKLNSIKQQENINQIKRQKKCVSTLDNQSIHEVENGKQIMKTVSVQDIHKSPEVHSSLAKSRCKSEAVEPTVRSSMLSVVPTPSTEVPRIVGANGIYERKVESQMKLRKRNRKIFEKESVGLEEGEDMEIPTKRVRKRSLVRGHGLSVTSPQRKEEKITKFQKREGYSLRHRPLIPPLKCRGRVKVTWRNSSIKKKFVDDKNEDPPKAETPREMTRLETSGSDAAVQKGCTDDSPTLQEGISPGVENRADALAGDKEKFAEKEEAHIKQEADLNSKVLRAIDDFKNAYAIIMESTGGDISSDQKSRFQSLLKTYAKLCHLMNKECDLKHIQTENIDLKKLNSDIVLLSNNLIKTEPQCDQHRVEGMFHYSNEQNPVRIKTEVEDTGRLDENLSHCETRVKLEHTLEATKTEPSEMCAIEDGAEANMVQSTCEIPDSPFAHNRGSRMLELIPESPKIRRSVYVSKPVKKPWNVCKNSRAFKMLALLPELQRVSDGSCPNETEPSRCTNNSPKDENLGNRTCGQTTRKTHHMVCSGSTSPISSISARHSPMRQKKLIRFDDDRNETVTYHTDSPPCLTVSHGLKFKGI